MKVTHFNNRTAVTFTLTGKGGNHVKNINAVYALSKQHDGQDMLFENKSPYKYSSDGKLLGSQVGSTGGTITFHSHSCDHVEASKELVALLNTFGLAVTEEYQEKTLTKREDGTPYKRPQIILERI